VYFPLDSHSAAPVESQLTINPRDARGPGGGDTMAKKKAAKKKKK
jgi:hypothetical protein